MVGCMPIYMKHSILGKKNIFYHLNHLGEDWGLLRG